MERKFKIDFITGSSKKFEEVKGVLKDVELTQIVIDLPEIQEVDAHKIIKAKMKEAYTRKGEGAFMIEDTSLYMDAIPGLPGPLVKWFLETIGVKGLAEVAFKLGNTRAKAKTIIGYATGSEKIHFFEGEVVGSIVEPRVDTGFGWDLIFIPEGYTKTFAEMTQEEKNTISMRGKAAQKLAEFLEQRS